MSKTKRPHILLIHSDQHRYDCIGANGHAMVRTPNLDGLAARGVNFSHAFTPIPICSPARASQITGRWPTQHGCVNIPGTESQHPGDTDHPVVWQLLADAGYTLGMVGKFHKELPGGPTDYGVRDYISGRGYEDWRKKQGLPELRTEWFGYTDEATPQQSMLHWEADQVLGLMGKYLDENEAEDSPVFIRWDPIVPHLPNRPCEPYASMYPPEEIPPWPSFEDPLTNKPYSQQQVRRNWGIEGMTWEQWQPAVSRYFAEITMLDDQVGRVLAFLEDRGIADNTLVIYSTDHGDMTGNHGMIDKHFNMYDDIMRVPLMMRWPGVLPEGSVCDAFICNELDIASTLCAAAGAEVPDVFEGRSLLDTALGRDPEPRPDIFAMYHGAQQGLYSSRMVRDREWKYVFNPTDVDELYHLTDDPGELMNLVDAEHANPHLRRLKGRTLEWMGSIGDPLLNYWTRRQLEG